MNSVDLRFFGSVARLGSMNRAASELNTVQSNVTARIRRLETDLGAELFARASRGVSPTEAGKRLLPYAIEMDRLLREARQAVLDDGIASGPLALGSLETTAAYRLAPIVATFSAAYPQVELSLRTATNDALMADVLERRLDGAFLADPRNRPDINQLTVFSEELVVVTRLGVSSLQHAVADGKLTIVVKGPGCSYRQRFEDMLSRRGVAAIRCIELGSLDAILAYVAAGLGATLLPRSVVEQSRDQKQLAAHRLPGRRGHVRTIFVSCSGRANYRSSEHLSTT